MGIFQGSQGNNQNTQSQASGQPSRTKSILRYTMMPEILPRIRALGLHFGHFAYLLALVFASARLLPNNHPALNAANIGRFGVRQVIAMAANNVTWSTKNIDQIAIFGAIVMGLIMIVIQAGLIAFAALVGFNPAEAQDIGSFFNPGNGYQAADDPVIWFFAQVFGDLNGFWGASFANDDYVFGTNTAIHTGIHNMLSLYSMAMMVIAVVIIIYYIMTVVGEAAKTGTPFGQRFNSLWAPIRLVLALGLLVPLGSGLNSAQYITLWTAKMGSGLGTVVWQEFLPSLENQRAENYVIGDYPTDWVSDLALNVFFMEICRFAEIKYEEGTVNATNFSPQRDESGIADRRYSVLYEFGSNGIDDGTGEWRTRCGEISINFSDVETPDYSDSITYGQTQLTNEETFNISRAIIDELIFGGQGGRDARPYIARQAANYIDYNVEIGGRGGEYVDLDTLLKNVVDYADNVKQSHLTSPQIAERVQNDLSETLQAMIAERDNSWVYAGVWYLELQRFVQNSKNVMSSSIPNFTIADVDFDAFLRFSALDVVYDTREARDTNVVLKYDRLEENTKRIMAQVYLYMQQEKHKYVDPDLPSACEGIDGTENTDRWYQDAACFIASIFIPEELTILASDEARTRTLDPMSSLISAGYGIFNKSWIAVGGAVVSALGPMAALLGPVAGVFGGILSTLGGLAVSMGLLGLGVGFILVFLLPVLPFMYFFFAIVAWVMEVAEAVVAMPLWALAHLRIDGDGMPGQAAANGYYLLLAILLRPALIVMSLVISSLVFGASIFLLQELFHSVLVVRSGGGSSGLETLIYSMVFAYIAYTAGITSFKLVDNIPNQILRWIGAGVSTFSDGHDVDLNGNQGLMVAAGGFVGSTLGQGLSQGASGIGQGVSGAFKEKKAEKLQAKGDAESLRRHKEMMGALGGSPESVDPHAGRHDSKTGAHLGEVSNAPKGSEEDRTSSAWENHVKDKDK